MGENFCGYMGQILRVDLSEEKVTTEKLDLDLARKYIGGRGLGAKILFDELAPGTDPLSPENVLIFMTGPLVGAPFFGIKHVVITKSPLTGSFLDSYGGGHFASELKFAGYDGVVITGKAKKPVYLYINDENVEIRDAANVWGKGCLEAEDLLKEEVSDPEARVAVVGPAAENLVKYAHISTDYYHSCGRGGAGTVMGSKNLKALVARGRKSIELAEPASLYDFLFNTIEPRIKADPNIKNLVKYGKALTMVYTNELGFCPTNNYQKGQFMKSNEIDGPAMRQKAVKVDESCYGCNLPCGKFTEVKTGDFAGTGIVGPEYETLCLLGSNVGVDSLNAIIKANEMCDDLGVDTMSVGNIIGFAMECYEKGYISKEDTMGLDLTFGNYEAVLKMIELISHREGIGDLLAEGVRTAAEKIGGDAVDFAMHAKGMEFPAYDPRGVSAMALQYAVSDRGACHRRASPVGLERTALDKGLERFTHVERARIFKDAYDTRIPMHCASICDTTGRHAKLTAADFAVIFGNVTGMEFTEGDMKDLNERVATLCLAFNLREKAPFTKQDNLSFWPKRMTDEPLPSGSARGQVVSLDTLEKMLDEYYELRGWDKETGLPTLDTMERLGLQEEAEQLEKIIEMPRGDN